MSFLLILPEFLGLSIEVYFINLFIGIVLYFIIKLFLKRFFNKDSSRKVATWVFTIILTTLTYASIILAFLFFKSYYPDKDFNRNEWINNENKRFEMTEDLIESEILIGKTKKEVIDYLGQTDTTKNVIEYNVGFVPRLLNIDPDIIEIHFVFGKAISVRQRGT
jgi:hypothetical protein